MAIYSVFLPGQAPGKLQSIGAQNSDMTDRLTLSLLKIIIVTYFF